MVEKAFSDLQVARCFEGKERIGVDLYFPFGNGVELPADNENAEEETVDNEIPHPP